MKSETGPTVRRAKESDIAAIAHIGSIAFSGLKPLSSAKAWVRSCWNAAPRMNYWVAESPQGVSGYILWVEKGGFRKKAVMELEQIAVLPGSRRQGIGAALVASSLRDIKESLARRGSRLKVVEVTTGSEQGAIEFYHRTIGTESVAMIPDLFRGDEYVLIARFGPGRRSPR
jgi:ribosomal protein S18 acetylase RimI-like enzyme